MATDPQPPAPGAVPTLNDGAALDQLTERAERWARSYKFPDDVTRRSADYRAKFLPEAQRLAAQSTAGPKRFGLKEWMLAVPLWLIIAAIVVAGSFVAMQPQGGWRWFVIGVGVAVFLIGIGAVWFDTTSPKRATKRYRNKIEWLLGAAQRTVERIFTERSGA